jgi:hypothetical protein
MAAAEAIVAALKIYVALGLVFGIAFVSVGVTKIDTAAKNTGPGFRLTILPGVVAFWPLLMARWRRS